MSEKLPDMVTSDQVPLKRASFYKDFRDTSEVVIDLPIPNGKAWRIKTVTFFLSVYPVGTVFQVVIIGGGFIPIEFSSFGRWGATEHFGSARTVDYLIIPYEMNSPRIALTRPVKEGGGCLNVGLYYVEQDIEKPVDQKPWVDNVTGEQRSEPPPSNRTATPA